MITTEKNKKLIEFSVVLSSEDKRSWLELLPKLTQTQQDTLYNVLTDEIKAWKKEGISLISDQKLESDLLSTIPEGVSLSQLKERLHISLEKTQQKPNSFAKELDREVNTPELKNHESVSKEKSEISQKPELNTGLNNIEREFVPVKPDNAWMLNQNVVVPKSKLTVITHHHMDPKPKSHTARYGLKNLEAIETIDDLAKIEPAHLRQGELPIQINLVKAKIAQLANANDTLPINIVPTFERSPLFQLYLQSGSMLIGRNLGVAPEDRITLEDIMVELDAKGQDILTMDEFGAVADLKKNLETMSGL